MSADLPPHSFLLGERGKDDGAAPPPLPPRRSRPWIYRFVRRHQIAVPSVISLVAIPAVLVSFGLAASLIMLAFGIVFGSQLGWDAGRYDTERIYLQVMIADATEILEALPEDHEHVGQYRVVIRGLIHNLVSLDANY